MGRRISIPLIVSPHTAPSFKTVCWTRGPVSSPAHVQDHEPRDGGPRQGLGRTAARAILGYATARASFRTSRRRHCISSFATAASMRAASLSRRRRPRGSRSCSTSICGVTRGRDATSSSTSSALPGIRSVGGHRRLGGRPNRRAALDENLVVEDCPGYVRVFDPGIFEPTAQSDDEPIDRHEAMREGDSMQADESPVQIQVTRSR